MRDQITIITPSLNSGSTIKKCIDSVKSQVNIKLNHIIVDGGSNDNTLEILKSNKSNYKILRKSSIYEALNYGFKFSNSELVGFLNSDDYYAKNDILSKVYGFYKANSNFEIYYGNCNFVNEKGTMLYKLISPNKHNFVLQKLRLFSISHPTWFIKHDYFEKNLMFDTSLKYVSDCDFIIRALKNKFRFKKIHLDMVNFQIHNSNASNTNNAKKEWFYLLERYNSSSYFYVLLNKILMILLYCRDPKYFFYKFNKAINSL